MPNTVRAYAAGVGKTASRLGEHRPLTAVADDEIGEALEVLWGGAAVNTWNARRAAVLSWLAWCRERGHTAPAVPAWAKRLAAPDSQTPARSRTAIDRLIARRNVGVREKTLYRLLYETAARAHEFRHSALTHLGEAGASLLMLMAKSRHKKPENLRRYFKPSPQAIAGITSLLAPRTSG
ncbi:hypothetical protein ABT120_45660 [Nonomuraea angiospora]|uniref:hypothetical protein n=1 Tax=Nonomuraea angiospora TaxID=46172 RepID=UPI00332BC933